MRDRFDGAKTTIIGLAREGTALARYLAGVGSLVTVTDLQPPERLAPALRQIATVPVRLVLGANRLEDALEADTLFLSPGVPLTTPVVSAARAAGVPVSSEPLLFVERCPAPIIGITGSSGKTTTTSLIGEMLRRGPRRVWVGGNIGVPLIGMLPEIRADDRVVMELSSFQLAVFDRSPAIAVVTSLSPDHLDRHGSVEEYYEAKRNIVRFQRAGDVAILNRDDPSVARFAEGLASEVRWFSLSGPVNCGGYLHEDALWIADGAPSRLIKTNELRLVGRHNVANALAAAVAAHAAGASDDDIRAALREFRGVPHRLEVVAEYQGVLFVNDSIATSPARAMAALKSFDRPIVWIAGGRSKNLPFDELVTTAAARVKRAVVYGEEGPRLHASLATAGLDSINEEVDFDAAVRRALESAEAGDVVLLSPACASFDQFRDFEARGHAFREAVQRWTESP